MRSNRRRLLAGDCLVQRISEICENHFLISANADRLGDPAEQPIPDATGLLSRVSVFSDLVKHFFFLTEFELESLFFFVAPNAQLHRFAGLLFAYPSPERSRNVGAVPVHNKVSGPQPAYARQCAVRGPQARAFADKAAAPPPGHNRGKTLQRSRLQLFLLRGEYPNCRGRFSPALRNPYSSRARGHRDSFRCSCGHELEYPAGLRG